MGTGREAWKGNINPGIFHLSRNIQKLTNPTRMLQHVTWRMTLICLLTTLTLQGIYNLCQSNASNSWPPPSTKSAFPKQLMTGFSAAVYVCRILSSVYSLSQGGFLSAVSKNVLNVFPRRKGARGPLWGLQSLVITNR